MPQFIIEIFVDLYLYLVSSRGLDGGGTGYIFAGHIQARTNLSLKQPKKLSGRETAFRPE